MSLSAERRQRMEASSFSIFDLPADALLGKVFLELDVALVVFFFLVISKNTSNEVSAS